MAQTAIRRRPTSTEAPFISPARKIELSRRIISGDLDPARRGQLGQYMTPWPIARFLTSLFETPTVKSAKLLEAGAGAGALVAAFVEDWAARSPARSRLSVAAYEIDDVLRRPLRDTLELCQTYLKAGNRAMVSNIILGDFIREGTEQLLPLYTPKRTFTHALLNPPYAKINTKSRHRRLLSEVGIETVNLYTAFVAVAFAHLADRGELVAIIPRSWCNGSYYRPFRLWMERHGALTHIHLFTSRREAFKEDSVLQENVIVRWQRSVAQGSVQVSSSSDSTFADFERHEVPFSRIVEPGDKERYVHIPTVSSALKNAGNLFTCTLSDVGIDASTGPVVDFRLKTHLRADPGKHTVPLLYAQHFRDGGLTYPIKSKKPNAIELNDETRRWLYPAGWYVVTKRFTAKEERRRIVAHVVDPGKVKASLIGLENHLNVFHAQRAGMDKVLAHGLALFLNSTIVDEYFRLFSGHTQVNVTDLRRMRYPSRAKLLMFGRWAIRQKKLDQQTIDKYIEARL